MKFIKNLILATFTICSAASYAQLDCPSLEKIQNAPISQIIPACEDGTDTCGNYAAMSFFTHDGTTWTLLAGVFSAENPLADAEALIDGSHAPEVENIQGTDACMYYGITWEDNNFKAVAAIPYDAMETPLKRLSH